MRSQKVVAIAPIVVVHQQNIRMVLWTLLYIATHNEPLVSEGKTHDKKVVSGTAHDDQLVYGTSHDEQLVSDTANDDNVITSGFSTYLVSICQIFQCSRTNLFLILIQQFDLPKLSPLITSALVNGCIISNGYWNALIQECAAHYVNDKMVCNQCAYERIGMEMIDKYPCLKLSGTKPWVIFFITHIYSCGTFNKNCINFCSESLQKLQVWGLERTDRNTEIQATISKTLKVFKKIASAAVNYDANLLSTSSVKETEPPAKKNCKIEHVSPWQVLFPFSQSEENLKRGIVLRKRLV